MAVSQLYSTAKKAQLRNHALTVQGRSLPENRAPHWLDLRNTVEYSRCGPMSVRNRDGGGNLCPPGQISGIGNIMVPASQDSMQRASVPERKPGARCDSFCFFDHRRKGDSDV